MCLQTVPGKWRVTGQEIPNGVMSDACKMEFYLEIKHYRAAVSVWRAEAVEVTILLCGVRWCSVSSLSAGTLHLELRRTSVFNCFLCQYL